MRKSRRKQDSDLTRIVGILFLELVGAVLLVNLAGFAQQQRSQLETPGETQIQPQLRQSEVVEKSLPKVALRRYNARW